MDLSNISLRLSTEKCAKCPNQTSCNILQSTLEWVVGSSHAVAVNSATNSDEILIQEIRQILVPDEGGRTRCKFAQLAHSEVAKIQDSVVEIFHRQQSFSSE